MNSGHLTFKYAGEGPEFRVMCYRPLKSPARYPVFMAAGTMISVQEYLRTAYRPDRDYVNGEVIERTLGEYDHAWLQTVLAILFHAHEAEWNARAIVEQRVQVREERFRVPDVCVVRKGAIEQIVTRAPLLCIEMLSNDDTLKSMHERIEDYLTMGVSVVWLLDPQSRRGYMFGRGMHMDEAADSILRAPNPGHAAIELPLADLFRE